MNTVSSENPCSVLRVAPADAAPWWDAFVRASNDGTLFHETAFLAYHGDRFGSAEHLLEISRKQRRIGVWPVALLEREGRLCALSPYGASYGGPALAESTGLFASRDIVRAAVDYVRAQGAREFRITLPPRACSRVASDTFRFALLEAGFRCTNRDITCLIPVDERLPEYPQLADHRGEWERRARKARKLGVETRHGAPLEDFLVTLEATYRKHGQKPTHTRDELAWLARELPDRIHFACAYLEGRPIAGVGYFVQNARVLGTFYLCQDPEYQATQAQSALLLDSVAHAREQGHAWIDLGTASVGMQAYDPIFRYKETLGAVGQFRETYVLDLAES